MDLACSDCSARGMASDWLLSLLLGTAVYGSVRTVVWKDGMGSNPMPPIRLGHKWKGTVEARKLRFLELYEDGASYQEIMTQLGLDEHDLRDWRATIRILGVSRFLMSHTVKTTYSYETKLAAVKARIEDQVSYQDILVAYGVAPKLLRRWCKIYSEHGEAGLQPKKRGRQLGAKQKPVQELTPMEKLELRIKQLEAENAILKKVAALKDWRN